ncbi:hypothetical protein D3C87_1898790 [compost metagenome]
MQTLAVHGFGGAALDGAERSDPAVQNRDIGQALAIMVDHGRVLENRVVLRHVSYPADG